MLHFQVMKFSHIFLFLFFLLSSPMLSYHHQFLMVQSAEQLYTKQLVAAINHRFLGVPLKDNGLFGQDIGANVGYDLKLGLSSNQIVSYSSASTYSQQSLIYKKSFSLKEKIWTGGAIHFDKLTLTTQENTTLSYTIFGAYVSESIDIAVNTIYKDYFSSIQMGFATAFKVIPKTKLFLEYLTPIKSYAEYGVFISGVKLMTFGHNFYLFLSNQNDVGYIPASSGSDENQLYSGFKIERIFDF